MALGKLYNKFSKRNLIISYKLLLNDLLFIEIVFFILAIIGESLLSGTDTSHAIFLGVSILAGITTLTVLYIGNKLGINLEYSGLNKKMAVLLILILIMFVLSSLMKINIFLNIVLTFFIIIIGYFTYKTVLYGKKED